MDRQLQDLKSELGNDLIILAHYYQNQEVKDVADIIGDSYKLSMTARNARAKNIIFCGVRFMAETAAILAGAEQHVFLPARNAECAMAKMAREKDLRHLYSKNTLLKDNFVPVVYVNSSAEVKAFAGRYGGSACTSSNAKLIITSILKKNKKVFFIPDKNLGMNTARALGISKHEITLVGPGPLNGITDKTRFCIWEGYCPVHHYMTVEQVEDARKSHLDAKVIVHPECPPPVVEAADYAGSTSQLLDYIETASSASTLVIGTEYNFVESMQRQFPDKHILHLKTSKCIDMHAIGSDDIVKTLQDILKGSSVRETHIDPDIKADASKPISEMIRICEGQNQA